MKKITLALSALALTIMTPLSYYTARQYLIQAETDRVSDYVAFEVSDEDALPLASTLDESERLDGRRGVGGDYDALAELSSSSDLATIDDLVEWDDL